MGPRAGGNYSKNEQSGRKVLEAFQRQALSVATIDNHSSDRIIVLLLIYDANQQLIGSSRYVINDDKVDSSVQKEMTQSLEQFASTPKNEQATKPHDGIILSGLVIEEVKTKAGRDFYQLFYASYLSNQVNGNQVVVVTERPALGTNTKISIQIENQLVFEFFVRSQYDYIKAMADQAIRRVSLYFEQAKRAEQLIKRY